jgi:intracellular multiplication protein IcmC
MKINKNLVSIFVLLTLVTLAGCSRVELPSGGIQAMLQNLADNCEPLIRLAVASAYLMGLGCIVSAMYKLRAYGEVRTMMPSNAQMAGPALKFMVGILLLFLPTVINISVYSLWHDHILEYPGGSDWSASIEAAIFTVIKLFGVIAVVRGLVLMARSSSQGAQPGILTKGLVHLVGGIMAINIWGTLIAIGATLGIKII